MNNYRSLSLGPLGGVIFVVTFIFGWWTLGGFIPPHSPASSASQIAEFYQTDNSMILAGLMVMSLGFVGLVPFYGLMSFQMARIEGPRPFLALCSAICAPVNIVIFSFPVFYWLAAAFRPEQSADVIRAFNDIAWIIMVWPVAPFLLQNVLFAIVVLSDKREIPLFPRWVGFFTLAETFLVAPAGLIAFFKVGPFAWNGVLSFWAVAAAYLSWMIVMSFALNNSIKVLKQEEAAAGV